MAYTYKFHDQYPLVQVYVSGRDTAADFMERIGVITSDAIEWLGFPIQD